MQVNHHGNSQPLWTAAGDLPNLHIIIIIIIIFSNQVLEICSELGTLKGLTELPVARNDVVAGDGTAVAGGDLEREALSVQVIVALPVLSPISRHGLPFCIGSFDRHRLDIAGAADVGDQHQVEV